MDEAVTSFDKFDEDEIRKTMIAFEKIVDDYKNQFGTEDKEQSLLAKISGNSSKSDTPLADQLDRRRRTSCGKMPEGFTIMDYDANDHRSVSECIVSRRIPKSEIRLQFEDKPYFTDEQIDGYLENIENVLKDLGVVWSDYDYDEELLEDGDEEFYTLAQNVFEKIYLDRTFEN